MIFASVKAVGLLAAKSKYPMFDYYDRFWGLFKDNSKVLRARLEFFALTKQKVSDRLDKVQDRPDIMSYIMKNQTSAGKAMTRDEIDSNAIILLLGGSETTATLLSGTTYLLLKNPEVYTKVVHEIRSRFKSQSEITVDEVNKLDYMIACLTEGLRYYPPVPTGFPRIVPKGGDNISGRFIPEGVSALTIIQKHSTTTHPHNLTCAVRSTLSYKHANIALDGCLCLPTRDQSLAPQLQRPQLIRP